MQLTRNLVRNLVQFESAKNPIKHWFLQVMYTELRKLSSS